MKRFLGELEQKVINVLWNSDIPMKPSEVQKTIKEKYAYTTIMTVLSRMEDKNLLKRKKTGKAFYYSPKKSKEEFAKKQLGGLFDSALNTYGDLAIAEFLDTIQDDPESIRLLKNILDKE